MSKKNKKRTKRYQGEDASVPASTAPVVHHYEAVDRGAVGQWWYEKKRPALLFAKIGGGITVAGWLLYELVRIVT